MKKKGLIVLVAIMAIIGCLLFVACDLENDNDKKSPEEKTPAERWGTWVFSDSTATVGLSVDGDGVATITVGGDNAEDRDGRWKAQAQYSYTANANTSYAYEFEAWTESSSTRDLDITYYYAANPEEVELTAFNFQITNTKATYTIIGDKIPKSGVQPLQFKCADQLGTFYVKIISITPNTGNNDPLDNQPDANRWHKWVADDSTATLDFTVGNDSVATVIVGGVAESYNDTDGWYRYKASVRYAYTATANTSYTYKFEAWTQSGTRGLTILYHDDWQNNINLETIIEIDSTRKTYTIVSEKIPKSLPTSTGGDYIGFQCADQLGTFYVKIISITPYDDNGNNNNNGNGDIPTFEEFKEGFLDELLGANADQIAEFFEMLEQMGFTDFSANINDWTDNDFRKLYDFAVENGWFEEGGNGDDGYPFILTENETLLILNIMGIGDGGRSYTPEDPECPQWTLQDDETKGTFPIGKCVNEQGWSDEYIIFT